MRKNTPEDFWKRVEKTSGCWLWRGSLFNYGYGQCTYHNKNWGAHRLAWFLEKGPIPDGLCVCHKCDNPICVRPDHLFLGTVTENLHDMYRKGRGPTGERNGHHTKPEKTARGTGHGMSKVTEKMVDEIRKEYAKGHKSQNAVGKQFGLTQSAVSAIILNKTWRHVA